MSSSITSTRGLRFQGWDTPRRSHGDLRHLLILTSCSSGSRGRRRRHETVMLKDKRLPREEGRGLGKDIFCTARSRRPHHHFRPFVRLDGTSALTTTPRSFAYALILSRSRRWRKFSSSVQDDSLGRYTWNSLFVRRDERQRRSSRSHVRGSLARLFLPFKNLSSSLPRRDEIPRRRRLTPVTFIIMRRST
jgi:hypothetical protein